MKRLLEKLPRSSSGSRDASASSSASRCPFDIFDVSITEAAGFPGSPPDESVRPADLALVSSAICFSGASSGDFIKRAATARVPNLSYRVPPSREDISHYHSVDNSKRFLDYARNDRNMF